MRKRINQAAVLTTAGVIAGLSLTRVSGAAGNSTGLFPVLHFLAYFGLAASLLVYFHDTERGHLEAFLAAAGFGLLLELVQSFLPYRSFSLLDITANLAGAAVVMLDHRSRAVTAVVRCEDRLIEKIVQ
ncbi:MAG: VanZ family protein [Candidatus Nanohaloarchaea archaeon]